MHLIGVGLYKFTYVHENTVSCGGSFESHGKVLFDLLETKSRNLC